jgi:hypothetical protein
LNKLPPHMTRRPRSVNGRRLQVSVSLDLETIIDLEKIAKGNKSAAIEMLVRDYHARRAAAAELTG